MHILRILISHGRSNKRSFSTCLIWGIYFWFKKGMCNSNDPDLWRCELQVTNGLRTRKSHFIKKEIVLLIAFLRQAF